jgi:hypothetical protein
MSERMHNVVERQHAINVDNTKIRRDAKWNDILNTTADLTKISMLFEGQRLSHTIDTPFLEEIKKNLRRDSGNNEYYIEAENRDKLIADINKLIEEKRLDMFRFLIVKYICETRKYTPLGESGVQKEEIKKLLENKEQLRDEIITYISMDKKFTEKQIKVLKNNYKFRNLSSAISDKDGTYTNYNSLFYIKIENDLKTISINYLNAEKHCNNSLTGPDFFLSHTAFYETIKKIFEYEDETYKTYLNFNTFDITKHHFVTNKEDKLGKGIKRFDTGACRQLMDEATKKNYDLVIKTINGEDTESVSTEEVEVEGAEALPDTSINTEVEVEGAEALPDPSINTEVEVEGAEALPDPSITTEEVEGAEEETQAGGAYRRNHKKKTIKRRKRLQKKKTIKKRKRLHKKKTAKGYKRKTRRQL